MSVKKDLLKEIEAKAQKIRDRRITAANNKTLENAVFDFFKNKMSEESEYVDYEDVEENSLSEGRKKTGTKLCARGKSAAQSKFKVYPSAYANGYAVQVCKGKIKGLDGKKHCSGAYC